MRILLISHYYSTHRGGIEIAAQRLAEALARHDAIRIDWMASDCDPLPERLPQGLRCIPARSWNGIERRTGLPYPVWSPGAARELWRALGECDVVHLHDSRYAGNVLAFLCAKRRGKPLVVTQHGGAIAYDSAVLRGAQQALDRTVARTILSRADQVVFVSPTVQRYFAAFCSFRRPPLYIPNGVDAGLYRFADAAQRAQRRPLCLFVGRFVRSKGVDLVLSLARSLPDVDWILAGDGPLRPEAAGLPNVKAMRGLPAPEVAMLYQTADLLVLPSRGEGFPLVVQEAMACGTPALVSNETAEGSPEARQYLFTEDVFAADAAAAWARRIAALLRDRDALHAMRPRVAQAARTHWSWQAAAASYLEVFGRVYAPSHS